MERRRFIKNAALASSAAVMLPAALDGCNPSGKEKIDINYMPISRTKKPLAIAMWDYTWILRHHRYGEFFDWDKVLEGLAERGYNAIRMDAMPQFVVSEKDGKIINEFRSVRKTWDFNPWGNKFSVDFRPREALLEFLPKCKKYGIRVGLATWFHANGIDRYVQHEETGLLRAWTETLKFLEMNDLLDNVIYVDLLNEYPNWHGYEWLIQELNQRVDAKKFILNNPQAQLPDDFQPEENDNRLFIAFYTDFANNLIDSLKQKFPNLEFYTSFDSSVELENIDLTKHAALDYHIWFHHNPDFANLVGTAGSFNLDRDLRGDFNAMLSYFNENKAKLTNWMDGRISAIAQKARENASVCGNTEGWGPIFWFDHPDLSWDWVKESAEICIDLAKKHDEYKFLCTSNFTQPQFTGMWDDIKWHKKITQRIKS
jgi:hypothetical protein